MNAAVTAIVEGNFLSLPMLALQSINDMDHHLTGQTQSGTCKESLSIRNGPTDLFPVHMTRGLDRYLAASTDHFMSNSLLDQ